MRHAKMPITDPPVESLHLRERDRAPILLRCEARLGRGPWKLVFVEDLSTRGFQIARVPGLRAGETMRIRVPGLELLTATVKWVRESSAGCEFDRPLNGYVLEHILKEGTR